ncbi:MAG: DUF6431 domain-containing protein [bacterium]|nr:DUF6431 domain-containing protein [bacterium]
MILRDNKTDFKSYRENSQEFRNSPRHCPLCHRLLTHNGSYLRKIVLAVLGPGVMLPIYRYRCRSCDLNITVLPGFLVPYRHYLKVTMVETVRLYLYEVLSMAKVLLHMPGMMSRPDVSQHSDRIYAFDPRTVGNWVKMCLKSLGMFREHLLGVALEHLHGDEAPDVIYLRNRQVYGQLYELCYFRFLAGLDTGPSETLACLF